MHVVISANSIVHMESVTYISYLSAISHLLYATYFMLLEDTT